MVGKTSENPAMSPHTPENTCTHHTDKQRKAGGEGEGRVKTTINHSTQKAPSSHHTIKICIKITSTTQSVLRSLLHVQI